MRQMVEDCWKCKSGG